MKSDKLQAQLKLLNLTSQVVPDLDSWQKFLAETDKNFLAKDSTMDTNLNQEQLKIFLLNSANDLILKDLIAGLIHEINNPLAVIQLRTDQLLELTESNDIKTDFFIKSFKSIDTTVKKITDIIAGLKTFAKGKIHDQMDLNSVSDTIEKTLALCQHRFKSHGIELELKSPGDFVAEYQCQEISEALIHLLNNSYEAVFTQEKKWVGIEIQKNQDHFTLTLTDSGPGIEKNIKDHIFQPFFTTKSAENKLGLGLSRVKNIIESHQGQFELVSCSQPTQFKITLPLVQLKAIQKAS